MDAVMYSDNPRYYRPSPSQTRQSSYTAPGPDTRSSPAAYSSAPASHISAGRGRYGGGLGVTHNEVCSPTPQRAPSGRMRAWADEDEVLSGNTASTGFQSAPQPRLPSYVGRQQQQQQWGHVPRHSLAGALSPGLGSDVANSFAAQSRSDLPQPPAHIGANPTFHSSLPSTQAARTPAHEQFASPASCYNTEAARGMPPLNPGGTDRDARRSSLARSTSGTADTSTGANAGEKRTSNKTKNRRKNKRRQDDEEEVEEQIMQGFEKGARRKGGPPPKAKLGGPGGETHEERQKRKESVEQQDAGGPDIKRDPPPHKEDHGDPADRIPTESDARPQPMYKDKPIEVRLPPSREKSNTIAQEEEAGSTRSESLGEDSHAARDVSGESDGASSKSPSEQTPGPFEAAWDGKPVKVALPSVPQPAVSSRTSSAEPWQPGPLSQTPRDAEREKPSNLEAPLTLELSRRDTFGTPDLSPVFASPALGTEDLGASPSTLGRTRENSTSEYQATISRAAFLRPSAPAFMPASRIFQSTVTSPAARNEIVELPASAPMQNRVVSDTSSDGPRKKLRPSATAFTPSHASARSRTSASSSIHSRLSIAAKTFSPKRGLASLAPSDGAEVPLVPDHRSTSTPNPSSRPSMTKVATSPSPAKGTLRAAAPSFMPVGEGTYTFRPPATNKGRPSLISAFEPPNAEETSPSQTSSRSSPGKDIKAGYLGGLGSGMSLPLKNATLIETSPVEPETSDVAHQEAITIDGEQLESLKVSHDTADGVKAEQQVSPVPPSEDTFGSMRASELFFKPPAPTPAVEKDDILSGLGITPIVSHASGTGISSSGANTAVDQAIQHKPEQSYDSEAGPRSGYVEDLGDFDEDYGEELGHAGSSDIEPDGDALAQHPVSPVRAHLPKESFGLPSPVDRKDVYTVDGPPIPLPSLQRVPRFIPADQPSSPTRPLIPDSPLQNQPTGPGLYRHFEAPETPHESARDGLDAQISASPTPAVRSSNNERQSSSPSLFGADYSGSGQQLSFAESDHASPQPLVTRNDPAADDTRFRNWVFPTPDKITRPGIERRYTLPLREIGTAPAYAQDAEVPGTGTGVASTLQERVSELRDVLGGRGDAPYGGEDVFGGDRPERPRIAGENRKPSVEFPPRPKTLKVVNATPKRQSLAENAEASDKAGSGSGEQEGVLRALADVRLAVTEMAKRQAVEKDTLQMRQILATIEGMRGDMLDASRRRGHEDEQDLALRDELSLLRQQLSEQNERFFDLSAQLHADRTDENSTSRHEEMFTALLSGQHAMLNKFSALGEDRDAEAEQLAVAVQALQEARAAADMDKEQVKRKDDVIHVLRQQLAESRVKSRLETAELAELRSFRAQREQSDKAQDRELEAVKREMDEVRCIRDEMEEQVMSSKAKQQAAERERDAIAEALGEAHGCREDLEHKVVKLRHELDLERNKAPARAVLPEIDVSAQVGELFSANKVFQDDLFAQIAFLQKDIVEAREANVEAVEEMMGEKAKLRERIEHLKHELDEAKSRATRSEIQAITESEHNLATMTILDSKLSSAIAARDTAEGKVVTLERAVEKLREEKENAQIVATERSSAMRHAEAQLAALAQENVYWRQFALSYDRREYRNFLGTKPFKDANGSDAHANVNGIDHDAIATAATGKSGVPVQSPVLQTPHANAEGAAQTFLTPGSSPLKGRETKGKGAVAPSTGASSLQATPDLSASTSTALSTRAPSKQ